MSNPAAKTVRTDLIAAGCLFAVFLALYVRTLAPSVLDENGGEYQYVLSILGIAHSTGYPLYTLLGKLFTLLPFGDIAHRVNLFSAVAAAGAVSVVYLAVRQSGVRLTAALGGAALLGAGSAFWLAATRAEVHALNALLVATVLLMAVRVCGAEDDVRFRRSVMWLALAFGLGLAHHRNIILLAPGLLVLVLVAARGRLRARTVLSGAGLVALPLLLYAYIPLRGAMLFAEDEPALHSIWPVPSSILRGVVTAHYWPGLEGFVNLVSGRDFASDVGFGTVVETLQRLDMVRALMIGEQGVVALLLSVAGLLLLAIRRWKLGASLGIAALTVIVFALEYRHGQPWYYFIPAYVILAVGYGAFWERAVAAAEARLGASPLVMAALGLVPLALPVWLVATGYSAHDLSGRWDIRAYAESAMSRLGAPNAVVGAVWDIATPLRYLQYAEGTRPDLVVVHAAPGSPEMKRLVSNTLDAGRTFYLLSFVPDVARKELPPADWVNVQEIPLPAMPEGMTGVSADFNGKVALAGARLSNEVAKPGDVVSATLCWRVARSLGDDYTLFLHVVGDDDTKIAQVDESPVTPDYPTSAWRDWQLLCAAHTLRIDAAAPAGTYDVLAGLYLPASGARLPIVDRPNATSLPIGRLEVEP